MNCNDKGEYLVLNGKDTKSNFDKKPKTTIAFSVTRRPYNALAQNLENSERSDFSNLLYNIIKKYFNIIYYLRTLSKYS